MQKQSQIYLFDMRLSISLRLSCVLYGCRACSTHVKPDRGVGPLRSSLWDPRPPYSDKVATTKFTFLRRDSLNPYQKKKNNILFPGNGQKRCKYRY